MPEPAPSPPAPRLSDMQVFAAALAIVAAYMLTREYIQQVIPRSGPADFEIYDLWMDLPRSIGFLACAAIAWRSGGLRKWGWHTGFARNSLVLVATSSAAFLSLYLAGQRIVEYTALQLLSGWGRTIPVALFEETCFRGLIFLSLRPRLGVVKAALVSSLLFTVFHWHAQPLSHWPEIFIYGFMACTALELGTGLPWLALVHEIDDSLWFHIGRGYPPFQYPLLAILGIAMYATTLGLSVERIKEASAAKDSKGTSADG